MNDDAIYTVIHAVLDRHLSDPAVCRAIVERGSEPAQSAPPPPVEARDPVFNCVAADCNASAVEGGHYCPKHTRGVEARDARPVAPLVEEAADVIVEARKSGLPCMFRQGSRALIAWPTEDEDEDTRNVEVYEMEIKRTASVPWPNEPAAPLLPPASSVGIVLPVESQIDGGGSWWAARDAKGQIMAMVPHRRQAAWLAALINAHGGAGQ